MGNFYDIYFEMMGTNEDSVLLNIYTDAKSKPNDDCTWFYRIENDNAYGTFEHKVIESNSGNDLLCDCERCKAFGSELYEYYSILLALKWVNEINPDARIILWVSSKSFIFDYEDELFGYDRFSCPFMTNMDEELNQFIDKNSVFVSEFDRKSRELASFCISQS